MIALISKYKSVLRFILTFMGAYILLTLIYGWYLQQSSGMYYYPDFFTHQVAYQCNWLLNHLGYNAQLLPHPYELAMKLMISGHFIARGRRGLQQCKCYYSFLVFCACFF